MIKFLNVIEDLLSNLHHNACPYKKLMQVCLIEEREKKMVQYFNIKKETK